MRPKSWLLLGLALGCGLIASIGITQVMEARNSQQKTGNTTNIYVATADVERNSTLSTDNVGLKPWPTEDVPQGAATKLEEIAGKRPTVRIVKGEPILLSKVGTGQGVQNAAKEIPDNYRVVSIRADNALTAGLILPGDRVDLQVFVVKDESKSVKDTGTFTFLQDVSVFAINSEISKERSPEEGNRTIEARTVSLLVTPDQAALVTLASEVGKIRLILRGNTKSESKSDPVPAFVHGLTGSRETGSRETEKEKNADNKVADWIQKQQADSKATVEDKMVLYLGSETKVIEFRNGEPVSPQDGSSSTLPPSTPPPLAEPDNAGGKFPLTPPPPKTAPTKPAKNLPNY